MIRTLLAAVLLAPLIPSALAAQRWESFALQGAVGPGTGLGGPQARHRSGAALDLLFTLRTREGLLVGAAAGMQGAFTYGDVCVTDPEGECLPDFPFLTSVGVVAGSELGSGLRALGGAELFIHDENDRAMGLTGRLTARLADSRIAPVATFRAAFLPFYRDEVLLLLSLGVGLRVR